MIIDLDKLKPIEIEDITIIDNYMKENNAMRSSFSPVNLFIWGKQFNAQYFFIDGKLVIYNKSWNCILLPSCGKFPPPLLKEISDCFYENGLCGKISFLDKDYIDLYRDDLSGFNIFIDRNNADYVYLSESLTELRVKKLQKKKNLISQFRRKHPHYKVLPLTVQDSQTCFTLSEKWITEHHRKHPGYKYEKEALKLAFKYFDELQLAGKKILIDGQLVAFTIFSELNDEMAVVHFEKFARDIKGSAQLVNWETAKHLRSTYKFINREEDMGVCQLRKAKKSYQPYAILDSYVLERKNSGNETGN